MLSLHTLSILILGIGTVAGGAVIVIDIATDAWAANIITVEFNSITVHNNHEAFGRGEGEYNLAAYVQGSRVFLTEATTNIVCGSGAYCFELWYADNGQTYYFKPGTEVTVDLPNTFPVSVFTLGNEVDGCLKTPFPSSTALTERLQIFDNPQLDWYTPIQNFQNEFATYGSCSLGNDNEVLGTINEFYDPPNYNAGPNEIKSSTGDFTLRYTISVIPQ